MKNLLIYLKNDEIVSKYKTFLTKGYKETDIVKMFWLLGLIASMIALAFGVML